MKLYLSIVLGIFCFLISCSQNNDALQFIVEGYIVGEGYEYNPLGFIDSPYGRVNIVTHSSFENGKLVNVSWNRANGALDYSLEDLKNDPKLYQSFNVDSIFNKNKKKLHNYSTKTIRNDTIFWKQKDRVLILKYK